MDHLLVAIRLQKLISTTFHRHEEILHRVVLLFKWMSLHRTDSNTGFDSSLQIRLTVPTNINEECFDTICA